MPESGVYITFRDEHEPHDRELPPLGPLSGVVIQRGWLIAEGRSLGHPRNSHFAADRWLEATVEFQRATGEEPGGMRREGLRVTAPDGIFLRFGSFAEHDDAPLAELGPFAVVLVGPGRVEADGFVLGTRGDDGRWELSAGTGAEAGAKKSDIAFRSASGTYHPRLAPMVDPTPVPRARPAYPPPNAPSPFGLPPRAPSRGEVSVFHRALDLRPFEVPPVAPERAAVPPPRSEGARAAAPLSPEDTLAARVARTRVTAESDYGGLRYRPVLGASTAEPTGGSNLRRFLWPARFAIILSLLLAIAGYALTRAGGTGPQAVRTVNMNDRVTGPRWEYVVLEVNRSQVAGGARARGTFVMVRISVTNRGAAGARLAPGEFGLLDAQGREYAAEPLASAVYTGDNAFVWNDNYPVGRLADTRVVFDVDPGAQGLLFIIFDVPDTKVRLR